MNKENYKTVHRSLFKLHTYCLLPTAYCLLSADL
jgi:hypothetical protein